ncbi:MAG: hypothetical protein QRY74_03500 [Chlamydia sp.]
MTQQKPNQEKTHKPLKNRKESEDSFLTLIFQSLVEQIRVLLDEEHRSQEDFKETLEKELLHFATSIQYGFELGQNIAYRTKDPNLQLALHEIASALKPLKNSIKYTKALLDFHSGKSWQEVLSLSRDALCAIYLCAKSLYESNQFIEASSVFGFLAWIDSKNGEIWTILGHSLYQEESYSRAISAYTVASTLLVNNPWPAIYASQACESIYEYEKGCLFLEQAIALTRSQKDQIHGELSYKLHQRLLFLTEKRDAIFS